MRTPSTTAPDFVSCRAGTACPRLIPVPVSISVALVLLLASLLVAVSSASAAEHVIVTGEYGKEGPKATGLGTGPQGCRLAYQSETQRLYLFSEEKIFGLQRTGAGSVSPLGGSFPITTGINSGCGDPDMDVDNSGGASKNSLYAVPSSSSIFGWSSTGTTLGPPWPVNAGGETCGVAVTNTGEVWGGNYGSNQVTKFTSAGLLSGSIPLAFKVCKLAIDQSNNDLYVQPYGGEGVVKYTAASGYTTALTFPASADGNSGLAVNGALNRLYVGNNTSQVKVYDTNTAALVETIELGESGGRGIAVDEATDTLFVTVGSGASGYIREYLGVKTPKATTGEPIGNEVVSGTADPNGVGPITECYFEFGLSTAYGSTQNCAESMPINSEQPVHAILPGLIGEETYHYRLVLGTGVPFVVGKGGDKTIVPHNVKALKTEPADEITNVGARLNASFEGTGEDTHYYFEWGRTAAYGHQTAIPPGEDAGVSTGSTTIHSDLIGLIPGTVYHYRVAATNGLGVSKALDKTFKTRQSPTVEAFLSSGVTATSANLVARINPQGEETKYRFEYGTTPEYGSVAPAVDGVLPAGNTTETVTVPISGLESVPYHFRLIVESKWGTTTTGDQTFNFYPGSCPNAQLRQQTGASFLPDCRAYELVSPENAGSVILSDLGPTSPVAENPSRFGFSGEFGAIDGAGDPQAVFGDTYIATRTNQGWTTKYVGIRGNEGAEAQGTPYSKGGAEGVYVSQSMDKLLDWDTGQQGFTCCGKLGSFAPYMWDYNGEPLGRLPTNLGEIPNGTADITKGGFVGDVRPSPDFSHYFFSSANVSFAPGGLTSGSGSVYDNNVDTGTIEIASLLPGGGDIPPEPGDEANDFLRMPAASTDGSHVLIEAPKTGVCGQATCSPLPEICGGDVFGPHRCPDTLPSHLYMRVDGAVTYDISGTHAVTFRGMTADGSKVFFTSDEKVTADDHDNSTDLFMWSENPVPTVTRISAGTGGTGDTDSCIASWITKCGVEVIVTKHTTLFGEPRVSVTDNAVAADSGDIYFYSPELLDGDRGEPGERNLYVFREGAAQYIATLKGSAVISRIQVSPDGDHAAFLTSERLTSYDNVGYLEMYSYDLATKRLLCVSCIPDGNLPTANVEASINGLFMSNDGRTFFATTDGLVDRDANGLWDIYEFVENRPQLISSGTADEDRGSFGRHSGLIGVSASGTDVYFSTLDTLVGQDRNGPFYKFYDARTNGGFPFVPPAAPCAAADECHGPGSAAPAPPAMGTNVGLGDGGNSQPAAHRKKKRVKKHQKKHRRHVHRERTRG